MDFIRTFPPDQVDFSTTKIKNPYPPLPYSSENNPLSAFWRREIKKKNRFANIQLNYLTLFVLLSRQMKAPQDTHTPSLRI